MLHLLSLCPSKSQSKTNIVSMVTSTFMGKIGLKPILSVKVPVIIDVMLNL